MKKILVISAMSLLILNTSCVKNLNADGGVLSNSLPAQNGVGFLNTVGMPTDASYSIVSDSSGVFKSTYSIVGVSTPTPLIDRICYFGTGNNFSGTEVSFELDSNIVRTADSDPNVQILPSSAYSINSSKIVIGSNKIGVLNFSINSSLLQISTSYAIGIRLVSTNNAGVQVMGNYSKKVLYFKVKNAYDANYDLRGFRIRYLGATTSSGLRDSFRVSEDNVPVTTVNGNTVTALASEKAIGVYGTFIVNPDNSITIDHFDGGTATKPADGWELPGMPSWYDPANKVMYVYGQYNLNGGALRVLKDTFTRIP